MSGVHSSTPLMALLWVTQYNSLHKLVDVSVPRFCSNSLADNAKHFSQSRPPHDFSIFDERYRQLLGPTLNL